MQFGVIVGNPGAMVDPPTLFGLAAQAEALGFDSVWISDHVAPPVGYSSKNASGVTPPMADYERCYDAITALAFLGGVTRRVRLGTGVLIVPQRNPIVTAKALATLDLISGGRTIVGCGVGWLREEYEALGEPRFDQRGAMMNEYLEIFRRLWTEETPAYEGRFYSFPPLRFEPKPAQAGGPPIWIGGHSRAALRRTARLASGWLPTGLLPEAVAPLVEVLREECDRAGRDFAELTVCVRVTLDAGGTPQITSSGGAARTVIGSSDAEIADRVEEYGRAGVTKVTIQPGRGNGELAAKSDALARFAAIVSLKPATAN